MINRLDNLYIHSLRGHIMKKIIIDTFYTKLGQVDLTLLLVENPIITKVEKTFFIKTKGYLITITVFDDVKKWIEQVSCFVEGTIGWILQIKKINESNEKIVIKCFLDPINEKISSTINTGEHLDAVWIENETDVLSIGTEDAESMKNRAKNNDWMPSRFQETLAYHKNDSQLDYFSFTTILGFGMKINVPQLIKDEKIYFHYLVAINKKIEHDISTNLAVDFPKFLLIERLNLKDT